MCSIQLIEDATLQVLYQRTDAAVVTQLFLHQSRPCIRARLAEAIGIPTSYAPAYSDAPSLVMRNLTFIQFLHIREICNRIWTAKTRGR
jgi:hypothetical protein